MLRYPARTFAYAAGGVALLIAALVVLKPWQQKVDFASLPVDERKARFVEHLCPAITQQNALINEHREILQSTDETVLHGLAASYGLSTDVDMPTLKQRLNMRVNTIPPELVIAQAALESGWGTSELAREENNLFGRRCFYVDDCVVGDQGERYRRFKNVDAAVRLYFRDLNTLLPYVQMRRIRAANGAEDPHLLAGGLTQYSSKGQGYVRMVQSMLKQNEDVLKCTSST